MHFLISDYLLIVGGWKGRFLDTVELVSPSNDVIPNCLRGLSNFPVEMNGAVATTMIGECNTMQS